MTFVIAKRGPYWQIVQFHRSPVPTDEIMYWCDSELAPQQFIRFHLLDCHRMAPMILSRRTFLRVTAGVASVSATSRSSGRKLTRLGQFEYATKR